MKYIIIILVLCSYGTKIRAQDLTFNPLGGIFYHYDIAYEHGITTKIGIQAALGTDFNRGYEQAGLQFSGSNIKFVVLGKYYFKPTKYDFNPKYGQNRFYLGVYSRFTFARVTGDYPYKINDSKVTRIDGGGIIGWKKVYNGGFIIEYSAGGGATVLQSMKIENPDLSSLNKNDPIDVDINFLFRITFGWRF